MDRKVFRSFYGLADISKSPMTALGYFSFDGHHYRPVFTTRDEAVSFAILKFPDVAFQVISGFTVLQLPASPNSIQLQEDQMAG